MTDPKILKWATPITEEELQALQQVEAGDWEIKYDTMGFDSDWWSATIDVEGVVWGVVLFNEVYEVERTSGWYNQIGEAERIEQIPILARAMTAACREFNKNLKGH